MTLVRVIPPEPDDGGKRQRAKVGRRSRLETEPELMTNILGWIRGGASPVQAAQAEGVPRRTWEDWLRRGRMGLFPYEELLVRLEDVKAQAVVMAEMAVARKMPDRWLRYSTSARDTDWQTGLPGGGNRRVNWQGEDDEELDAGEELRHRLRQIRERLEHNDADESE